MKTHLLPLIVVVSLMATPPAVTAAEPAGDGWITLFDGKDLSAWKMSPEAKWAVVDGAIALVDRTDGALNNADYLWTKETYADFILELEFKVCEGHANSGVFLRTPDLDDPVYTGIEMQVANSHGKEPNRKGTAGAIYDCASPTANTVKPAGQWNRCRITCRGSLIQIELNGQQITEMDLDRWTTTGKNPDGTTNKFRKPLKDFARAGHVGFQDHARPISYRSVRIKRLGEAAGGKYTLTPDEHGQVLKTPEGQTVFRYMTKKPAETNLTANSVCCLYPVFTPAGIRAVDFAPGDHRHHRGVFLAWHATTCGDHRADFWGWGEMAPTEDRVIRNRSVKLAEADAEHAVLEVRNDWTIGEKVAIEEALAITARQQSGVSVIDLDFNLTPKVELKLDQTAFGGFCVKGRKDGKTAYHSPKGKVDLPNPHHLQPQTDWPAAAWYDYVVELDEGETVGVAVLEHAGNPPSTWHNLEPIAMVNPCIVAPGAVSRKPGQPLRLRYRLAVHDGPVPAELLDKLSKVFRSSE